MVVQEDENDRKGAQDIGIPCPFLAVKIRSPLRRMTGREVHAHLVEEIENGAKRGDEFDG